MTGVREGRAEETGREGSESKRLLGRNKIVRKLSKFFFFFFFHFVSRYSFL